METKTKARRRETLGIIAPLVLIFWCSTLLASGRWVPFVAQRLMQTYQLSGNSKKLIAEKSEVWLRNSQGSIYLRGTPIVGVTPSAAWETASLFDAASGTTYLIDYKNQTVTAQRKGKPVAPPTAASFHSHMPQSRFIGRKTIDGIECEGWRMVWSGGSPPPNSGQPAGEIWVAPSLNFAELDGVILDHLIGEEIDVHVVSISPGQEPDTGLFQLPPAGFSLIQ